MADDATVTGSAPSSGELSSDRLGRFLRARRDQVTPAQVGLPAGPRRRAPGLRRSEVAMLAGVSVEYLTRLEQGRDRNPSSQVLGALADALRLSASDRHRLHMLAKLAAGASSMCPAANESPAEQPTPALVAVLDRLEPGPAFVVNRLGDVLAHTAGFAAFAEPIGMLDGEPPNVVRYLFTDPRAMSAHPDWEVVADAALAPLRVTSGLGDEHVAAFVAEMEVLARERFAARWAADTPGDHTRLPRRVIHPDIGEASLVDEVLQVAGDVPRADEQRLIVILPADRASAAALDRLLVHSPAGLRVVGS